MAVFHCDRCGKCCVSLGPLISIKRQLNDRDYYCHNKIDNTVFTARVDAAFREEISDEFLAGGSAPAGPEKRACPFLRRDPQGAATCAIYPARPKVCRDFRCYRMLIHNREGIVCGRVIGKNALRTGDTVLEALWNGEVATIPCDDAAAWTKKVTGLLHEHGYRADPVG